METILIIDDYPPLLRLYAKELKKEGYQVVAVRNLAEAIPAVEDHSFAAVIVEILALWKEEFETLTKALHQKQKIPIIINTAEMSRGAVAHEPPAIAAWIPKSTDLRPLKNRLKTL